jgi:GDP-L-fucose synthase
MKRILVTGGTGQVGKELQALLPNAIYISSKEFDLTSCVDVEEMLILCRPDVVIHAAARVGGILDNITHQVEYFTENVLMNTLLVDLCLKHDVENFIGILSTCIYPDVVDTYPMKEEVMHDGRPTKTNFSYGIAKRAMATHIDAIREQHEKNYCYVIPCNLYGTYDKYNERSHFVGAVLKKIHEAESRGEKKITLFGSGKPLRQILYAKDLALILKTMVDTNTYENFNIANEENLSIHQYARTILDSLGFSDWEIEYDSTKPDGQYRKDVSLDRFKTLFPNFEFTPIKEGIVEVYKNMKL